MTAIIPLSVNTVQAATFTWNGSSPTSNDFSQANWTGAAPADINGHVIAFGPLSSPSRTTANNNLGGNPEQFIFNAGAAAMTITGTALQFATGNTNPIVNDSSNLQTFGNEVRQFWFGTNANRTWSANTGNLSFGNVGLYGSGGQATNTSLTITGANDTLISGNISLVGWTTGGASLFKEGVGKLTLGGNSALDTVILTSGTLRLTGGTLTTTKQVSTTGLGIKLTAGTLEVAGGNISVGTQGLGTFSADAGSLNVTDGNVNIAGALMVGWNSSPTFTVNGGTLTSGSIRHQDGGNGILTIGGTGVVTTGDVFHNANGTGTDSLTLNLNTGGELVANRLYMSLGTNAQGSGNHSLNVNFDGGTLKAGASAASNLIDATPSGTSTRAINLTVKAGGAEIDTNGKTVAILQPFLHDAALGASPDGGLNKTGAGTLTLSAASTYTGLTAINNGTLALGAAGSINNTSGVQLGGGTFDVSAKSGYTVNNLTGNGTVVGALTVSTTLAIGSSPGQISFGDDLTLGASSTFNYEFTGGATTADLGIVSGDLTINSTATLNLFQLGTYTINDVFTLLAYDENDISVGTFAGLAEGATTTDNLGGLWRINYGESTAGANYGGITTGLSFVNITAIPEPGAALLGGLGLLLLLRRRRN